MEFTQLETSHERIILRQALASLEERYLLVTNDLHLARRTGNAAKIKELTVQQRELDLAHAHYTEQLEALPEDDDEVDTRRQARRRPR